MKYVLQFNCMQNSLTLHCHHCQFWQLAILIYLKVVFLPFLKLKNYSIFVNIQMNYSKSLKESLFWEITLFPGH